MPSNETKHSTKAPHMPLLSGQTALITGAASGLGLGLAQRLGALGARLLLADVAEAQLAAAAHKLRGQGVSAEAIALDLADPASIVAASQQLLQRGAPLHMLANNAGIYPPSQRRLTRQGQELSFAIGHLGHFALTVQLLPLLRAAGDARVVHISSLAQRQALMDVNDLPLARGYTPIAAYRQTKLACLLFAQELNRRAAAQGLGLISAAAHPGVVRTALGDNRPRAANDRPWQRAASWLLANGMLRFGCAPDAAAEAPLQVLQGLVAGGSFIGPTGWFEASGRIGHARASRLATPQLGAALWAASEAITGCYWPAD